jgi:3-oxoacyl-[acyl-carrier protein] reductase
MKGTKMQGSLGIDHDLSGTYRICTPGSVALVTGASSGIGRATANMLAARGFRVAVNYHRNRAAAEALVDEISTRGQEALAVRADVSQWAEVEAMVQTIRGRWGRIDILCNNAADTLDRQTVNLLSEDLWDRTMAVNLKSAFLCVKAVWDEMVTRRSGSIVNVTSVSVRNGGGAGNSAYVAAKGGLEAFTRALAKELVLYGIRVNAVAPGLIETPIHQRNTAPAIVERALKSVPMGRMGTPEEIAEVILFLVSPAAQYMTGETVEVNGGMLMG